MALLDIALRLQRDAIMVSEVLKFLSATGKASLSFCALRRSGAPAQLNLYASLIAAH
jgi:hypothetical protein